MITINERPPDQVAREALEQLRGVPPAAIGHVLEDGFMDPGLRPVGRRRFSVCGPALTVRIAGADSAAVHHAITLAQPGDVIVIEHRDDRHACWGEMTSLFAQARGVAAVIVEGLATDSVALEELGFVVFARGISPLTTRAPATFGEINTPVSCGGVAVSPGDIVLADDDGVLVIPPARMAEALEIGAARVAREHDIRTRLAAGEALPDISGVTDRMREVREGQVPPG